jgi:hypothetical protein
MKTLISILCIIFTTASTAQQDELQYFKVDGNNLTWQKVFPTVLSVDEMREKFKELDLFEEVRDEKPGRIAGVSRVIEQDYLS